MGIFQKNYNAILDVYERNIEDGQYPNPLRMLNDLIEEIDEIVVQGFVTEEEMSVT